MKADVVTPWSQTAQIGSRPELSWEAEVYNDYKDQGLTYSDLTYQAGGVRPPDPNLFVVRVRADESVIDQIDSDNKYYILHREGDEEGLMSSNEFGQLRAYLATQGVSQAQIDEAVTDDVTNFNNRIQVVTRLKGWLYSLCGEYIETPPSRE